MAKLSKTTAEVLLVFSALLVVCLAVYLAVPRPKRPFPLRIQVINSGQAKAILKINSDSQFVNPGVLTIAPLGKATVDLTVSRLNSGSTFHYEIRSSSGSQKGVFTVKGSSTPDDHLPRFEIYNGLRILSSSNNVEVAIWPSRS